MTRAERMANPNRKLDNGEVEFINKYMINGFNATRAYYESFPNTTITSASSASHELKNRPAVKKEIKRRLEARVGDCDLLAQEIIDKLREIAFADKSDELYNPTLAIRAIDSLQKQLNLVTTNVNISGGLDISVDWGEDDGEQEQ